MNINDQCCGSRVTSVSEINYSETVFSTLSDLYLSLISTQSLTRYYGDSSFLSFQFSVVNVKSFQRWLVHHYLMKIMFKFHVSKQIYNKLCHIFRCLIIVDESESLSARLFKRKKKRNDNAFLVMFRCRTFHRSMFLKQVKTLKKNR